MKPFLPKVLLHLEGPGGRLLRPDRLPCAEASWLEFAVLFLGPDVAILAYVFGKKIGGAVHNSVHTYTVVGVCVACLWPIGRVGEDCGTESSKNRSRVFRRSRKGEPSKFSESASISNAI
jgi:hypothetical protein